MEAAETAETDPLVAEILADPDFSRARAEVARLTEASPAEGAVLLERLATAAEPAPRASAFWIDAAALWAGAAGDAKRAARALRAAIEVCPDDDRALDRLVTLYRDNGKHRALARILERRAEALLGRAEAEGAAPDARKAAAGAFALLGDLLRDPPLDSPADAIAVYHRAIATGAASPATLRAARVLYLRAGQVSDALPLFALERDGELSRVELVALCREEAAARKLAGDAAGQLTVLRLAHRADPGAEGLGAELAGAMIERLEAGEALSSEDRAELSRILKDLEEAALGETNAPALRTAFTLAARALSGAARAAELVRQAEVLVGLGAEPSAAVRHAEPGLAALSPADAAPSLARLAALLGGDEAVDLLERFVARAAPEARPHAIEIAFRESSKGGSLARLDRLLGAFVAGVAGGTDAASLDALEKATTEADHRRGGTTLRGFLAAAMARAEPGAGDAGRAKTALLRRAARIARRDLEDADQAFEWLADALFARLEAALAPLEAHLDALRPPPARAPSSPSIHAEPPVPRVVVFGPPPPTLPPPPQLPAVFAFGAVPPDVVPQPISAPPVPVPGVEGPGTIIAPADLASAPPPPVPARPPSVPAPAARPPSVPAPPARPPSVPAPAARPPSQPVPAPPRPAPRPRSVPAPPPPRMELADPFPSPAKARPSVPAPPPAPPASPVPPAPPPPAPRAAQASTPPSSEMPAKLRATGEELISDLFESMHALDFCKDSVEAAAFTLKLAMEKLGSDTGAVHLYDIDHREFVVVQAAGPGAEALRGLRTPDTDDLAAEAMRRRGAFIVAASSGDPLAAGRRWEALAAAAGRPVGSIACARAAQAGRFLGLVELANLADSGAFEEGDEHALTYISERFAEIVAARGVLLEPDSTT